MLLNQTGMRQIPHEQAELPRFFPKAYAVTQVELPRKDLRIHCQKRVRSGKHRAYVSFVGFKDGGIFIAALSRKRLRKPGKNLRTRIPRGGLPPSATMDWGYVFDRNHDGRVDYLAYLDGINPVVPDDWRGHLPNLTRPFTGRELKEIVLPNTRAVFWHMADDDFDGRHDGLAVSMRDVSTGWLNGWVMARDTNFDGRFDACVFYRGRMRSKVGDCDPAARGFGVKGERPSGLSGVPAVDEPSLLTLINQVAKRCRLQGESFLPHQK